MYAIIGANGAGKSTLLRTIAGLHQPTEGAILYDGKDMTTVRPERRVHQSLCGGSSSFMIGPPRVWQPAQRRVPPNFGALLPTLISLMSSRIVRECPR